LNSTKKWEHNAHAAIRENGEAGKGSRFAMTISRATVKDQTEQVLVGKNAV